MKNVEENNIQKDSFIAETENFIEIMQAKIKELQELLRIEEI